MSDLRPYAELRDPANWSRDRAACGCVFWTFQHPTYDIEAADVPAEINLLLDGIERLRRVVGAFDAARSSSTMDPWTKAWDLRDDLIDADLGSKD